MVADLEPLDVATNCLNDTRRLVGSDDGQRRVELVVEDHQVGVAEAACLDLDEHLVGLGGWLVDARHLVGGVELLDLNGVHLQLQRSW